MAHRRLAEVERARLERQLEALHDALPQWEFWGYAAPLAQVKSQIATKTARLEALLGASDGISPASD